MSRTPAEALNGLFAAHGDLGRAATGECGGEGELLVLALQGTGRFSVKRWLKLEQVERRGR